VHFAVSLQRAAAGEYIFAATNLIEADVPALIVRVSRNFDAWQASWLGAHSPSVAHTAPAAEPPRTWQEYRTAAEKAPS